MSQHWEIVHFSSFDHLILNNSEDLLRYSDLTMCIFYVYNRASTMEVRLTFKWQLHLEYYNEKEYESTLLVDSKYFLKKSKFCVYTPPYSLTLSRYLSGSLPTTIIRASFVIFLNN